MEERTVDNSRQCRLCLDYIKQLLPIFGQVGSEKNVAQLLQAHLHLQVNEDQPLPKHICLSCLETVEAFDKFYVNVAQNQSFLMQNEEATVGILVRNGEYVEHDDDNMTCAEVIEKPVVLNDSFHSVSKEDPATNPPSYDEVQQNKRAQLIPSVATMQPASKPLQGDHYYIEEATVEPVPNADVKSVTLTTQVVASGDAANDDEDNVSEWEIDGDGTAVAPTDDEEGFLVRVNKFKYPKMIVDGMLAVRGEALDKCLQEFYGLTCELCKENSATMETLSEHYRKVHNVDGGYVVCCGRKLEKRLLMAMHMAKHLQPEAFECPVCKKMMTSPRILRLHIRNHLPEEERPLKCDLCPRRFSYVSGLLTHASTHQTENKSNRVYHICDTCGRAYRTRSRLMNHISEVHTGGGSSQCTRCDTCGKQFSSKSNLNYHKTTHEPNVHQEQCEHCGKWLKNKICLRKHMLQHSDLRYQCSSCDYSTTNGQRMQSHLRVQHTDEKPYVCPECGKAFKLRCNLRNHMPQHTGERNFKCEFCSRQFVSNSNYYSHRKRKHFEEMELKRKEKELKDRETRIELKKQ